MVSRALGDGTSDLVNLPVLLSLQLCSSVFFIFSQIALFKGHLVVGKAGSAPINGHSAPNLANSSPLSFPSTFQCPGTKRILSVLSFPSNMLFEIPFHLIKGCRSQELSMDIGDFECRS